MAITNEDYKASELYPKNVTVTNTTNNEYDLQMYQVNLHKIIGGRNEENPDGQSIEFTIESSEEFVYYDSLYKNLGDEWNLDNDHKITFEYSDAGGGSSAVLIEKSITANGVYNASEDQADGYSKVTVEVPASSLDFDWESYTKDHQGVLQQDWLVAGVSKIEIPEGITSIEAFSCSSFPALQEVVIPNTVTSIGQGAFYDNRNVTSLVIPSSVETIGNEAFGCESGGKLASLTFELPCQLESLPDGCFADQEALESVVIPDSITTIEASCFSNTALKSVLLPNQLTELGDSVFHNSGIESITLPNTLTTIGVSCFEGTSLTQITIPASVTSIGEDCFSNCSALETITINKPEGSIEGAPWGAPETTQIIWNG